MNDELNYKVTPGEILKEYMKDKNISVEKLAEITGIDSFCINEILNGKQPITESISKRLERAFTINKFFWMNIQALYDKLGAK